ncbi:MAG: hypothetical protein R3F46_03970 [bacterium]
MTSFNSQNLVWFLESPGDYDENGEVNVGDLTPLGQYFGASGNFSFTKREFVIDGDGNGEINLADLTTIAANYGRQVASYAIYRSSAPDSDYPQTSNARDSIEPEAVIPLGSFIRSVPDNRFGYSHQIADFAPDDVFWVRPLDQQGLPGIASNRTDQPSNWPGGSAPLAFIKADVSGGEVPFTVNFNLSDSYDPDGDALEFSVRLDTDEDNIIGGTSASALQSLDVLEPGNYRARATVSDGSHSSTSAELLIIATAGGNHQPEAHVVIPQQLSGDAPFTLTLDMSASTDVDGGSLRYGVAMFSTANPEAYFSGDGYVQYNGANPVAQYTLEEPGYYELYGRVWDSGGLTDLSEHFSVVVTEDGNQPPSLFLSASKSSIAPGEMVTFSFHEELNFDPDGEIVKYEFDPEGTGDWIEFNWENNSFVHTYLEGGTYIPRVRALDDDGLYGYHYRSGGIRVSGDTGADPLAVLVASSLSGKGSLTVDFSNLPSSDSDGVIRSFAMDFGDGRGLMQLGLKPGASRSFGVGMHLVKLLAVDNRGNEHQTSVLVDVEEFGIGF